MLGKLRGFTNSKLAGVLVAIIIVPFVFWGMGSVFSGGNSNNIAKINNEAISTQDFIKYVNPNSLVKKNGYIEPYATKLKAGERVQFQRQGYFIVDKINADKQIIFNKTTGLRDSFKNQKNIR